MYSKKKSHLNLSISCITFESAINDYHDIWKILQEMVGLFKSHINSVLRGKDPPPTLRTKAITCKAKYKEFTHNKNMKTYKITD